MPNAKSVDAVMRWREDTPGCARVNHLNNAGAALMPRPVLEAVRDHLERESVLGGYEAADAAADDVQGAYEALAGLVGAQPRNIAITENATVSFALAVSAFDLGPGDVILTTRNDYISNQLLFLSLARRLGVEVRRAPDLPEGGVDPEAMARAMRDPRCKLVSVTWVPTNSGLVQPVAVIGDLCREAGIPYVIDACQAVGQLPIDVRRLHCDFLSATGRKFLRGPRGIGFLYVSDRVLREGWEPLPVDMRGATWTGPETYALVDDARRFENWEFAYANVLGLGAAARYALDIGVREAGNRARALADRARTGLEAAGFRVLDRGHEPCAIATVALRDGSAPEIVRRLRDRGINVSAIERAFAVIDMKEKGVESGLRISPHYYNTEEEIDAAVAAIGTAVRP